MGWFGVPGESRPGFAGAFARVGIAAALLGSLVALAASDPARAAEEYRVMISRVDSSRFPEVKFNATVLDAQFIPVNDVTIGDWELIEDGAPVKLTEAGSVTSVDNPISVVV